MIVAQFTAEPEELQRQLTSQHGRASVGRVKQVITGVVQYQFSRGTLPVTRVLYIYAAEMAKSSHCLHTQDRASGLRAGLTSQMAHVCAVTSPRRFDGFHWHSGRFSSRCTISFGAQEPMIDASLLKRDCEGRVVRPG